MDDIVADNVVLPEDVIETVTLRDADTDCVTDLLDVPDCDKLALKVEVWLGVATIV